MYDSNFGPTGVCIWGAEHYTVVTDRIYMQYNYNLFIFSHSCLDTGATTRIPTSTKHCPTMMHNNQEKSHID